MDEREIRLRCIEAAAKNPVPHPDGFAAGAMEAAQQWFAWINALPKATLGLPPKGK